MKSFTLAIAFLAVAASANAVSIDEAIALARSSVEKQTAAAPKMNVTPAVQMPVLDYYSIKKAAARANSEAQLSARYIANNALYLSISTHGYGRQYSFPVVSPYAPATWSNVSTGYSDFEWSYFPQDAQSDEDIQYSTDEVLSLQLSEGYFQPPYITVIDEEENYDLYYENLAPDMDLNTYSNGLYFVGNLDTLDPDNDWSTDPEGGTFGVMTYAYKNYTNEDGYAATTLGEMGYDITAQMSQYFTNGTYNGWIEDIPDAKMRGFACEFPEPLSPYEITQSWVWADASFSKATILTMELRAVTDEGIASDPFAIGYCSCAAGSDQSDFVFDLTAVDEEGDETEEPIKISTGYMATIIVSDDSSVSSFYPVMGNGTVLPDEQSDWDYSNTIFPNHAYAVMDATLSDKYSTYFIPCVSGYWTSTAHTEVFFPRDYYWAVDAKFVNVGEDDGIQSISAGSADVVAREYFDLQGRKLNAAPEAGLYIERAVKADGSATTTKLAK